MAYFRLETISGGVGRNDEAGCLYAADRKTDVTIGGGSNVYEREVKETLLGLDGSAERGDWRPASQMGREVRRGLRQQQWSTAVPRDPGRLLSC